MVLIFVYTDWDQKFIMISQQGEYSWQPQTICHRIGRESNPCIPVADMNSLLFVE